MNDSPHSGAPTDASSPARVKDAATVLLLREAPEGGGVEVFMQVRVRSMAFAAGAAVFPGGSVDPSDADGTAGWGEIRGAQRMGAAASASEAAGGSLSEHLAGAIVSAALRETFEECGVALVRPAHGATATGTGGGLASGGAAGEPAPDGAGGDPASGTQAGNPTSGTAAATLDERDRDDLSQHRTGLAALLAARGLTPDLDALACVDRWITPEGEPRRYDTRFFAAALPAGAVADDRTTESSRSFWVRPADALAQFAAGELALMPPTWAQLDRLSRAGTVAEAMVPAEHDITVPTLEHVEGTVVAHFWGSEAYRTAGRPQHS